MPVSTRTDRCPRFFHGHGKPADRERDRSASSARHKGRLSGPESARVGAPTGPGHGSGRVGLLLRRMFRPGVARAREGDIHPVPQALPEGRSTWCVLDKICGRHVEAAGLDARYLEARSTDPVLFRLRHGRRGDSPSSASTKPDSVPDSERACVVGGDVQHTVTPRCVLSDLIRWPFHRTGIFQAGECPCVQKPRGDLRGHARRPCGLGVVE
jgi:hypothetical protein